MFLLFLYSRIFKGLGSCEAGTVSGNKINEKYIWSSEKTNFIYTYKNCNFPQMFARLLIVHVRKKKLTKAKGMTIKVKEKSDLAFTHSLNKCMFPARMK